MPRTYLNQSKIDLDFNELNNVEKNKLKYLSISSSECFDIAAQVKIILPAGYRLVRTEKNHQEFQIVLLSDITSEVVYYIDCLIMNDIHLNAKPVTQVLLWRTSVVSHRKITSGITDEIFRNYLLNNYTIVASDGYHTLEGRDFWVRQLGYALEYGEHVYRYNQLKCELIKITDHAVIRDNSCDLWGDDDEYANILAVISKDELPMTKETF